MPLLGGQVFVVKRGALYLTRDGAWSTKQRDARRFDDVVDVPVDAGMLQRIEPGTALHRAEYYAAQHDGRAVELRRKG